MTKTTQPEQDTPAPQGDEGKAALAAGRLPDAPLPMPTQTIETKAHGLTALRDILGAARNSAGA